MPGRSHGGVTGILMGGKPSFWSRYKLRLKRKRLLLRAFRKRKEIKALQRRTHRIKPADVLLFATVRNEMLRLPFFLQHYRRLGIDHFLIVDNASTDGTAEYLTAQPDVSLWQARAGYKASRFGMDWLTCLLWCYGHRHWCVTVDADELLVYPDWESRDLHSLTGWMDEKGIAALGTFMLELYPKGPVEAHHYTPGQDPTEVANWFDAYGYWVQRQEPMKNLWLQGGVRARYFFQGNERRAPTLNKIPLVRWNSGYVYVNSTHNALPPRINQLQDTQAVKKPTGVLLHTKFLSDAAQRAREEKTRGEHFADAALYQGYYDALGRSPDLWCEDSTRYEGWEQLERLRLMFRGDW